MDAEAVKFLMSNGLQPHDSFLVAHVRHGSKGTEQALLQPEQYVDSIKRMTSCLRTQHVFLVTETASVVERMLELGQHHGFHVFTVKYNMPGHDVWNPAVVSGLQHGAHVYIAALYV
jgi:hypothetical protein